jgi:hypothetical protein
LSTVRTCWLLLSPVKRELSENLLPRSSSCSLMVTTISS